MHKEKYTAGACGHMLQHYDRSKEQDEHVNTALSHLNYNLAREAQPLQQLDFIHRRLDSLPVCYRKDKAGKDIPIKRRKDAVVMCDWIVTKPKELPTSKQEQFFKESYNFLCGRYGKENVVSAYVHLDEPNAQPHMHFSFVPVTKDQRLCAKDVVTRADLKQIHPQIQKHLEAKLQCKVDVLTEATQQGNKSIDELKRITATGELQRANATIDKANALKGEIDTNKALLDGMERELYPTGAKAQKSIFGKETVTVSKELWEQTKKAANMQPAFDEVFRQLDKTRNGRYSKELEQKLFEAQRELEAAYAQIDKLEHPDLDTIIENAGKETQQQTIARLKNEHSRFVSDINKVLSSLPDEQAKAFVQAFNGLHKDEKER